MQHFHNMFLKYPCSKLNIMKIKETSQKRGVIVVKVKLFGRVSDAMIMCKLGNLNCRKLTNQNVHTKVRSFYHTVVQSILISFKIVLLFNITLADFVLMSADVVLKSNTILKEMRIVQLSS